MPRFSPPSAEAAGSDPVFVPAGRSGRVAREGPSSSPLAKPYPAQNTQPVEPILFPKLRIRLAEFPYATLFYAPETAHLGDLMRIRYGRTEAQRISPSPGFSRAAEGGRKHTEERHALEA